MAGIYSGDGAELSLAATFPQLRTAERLHGGLIKGVLAARREAQMRPVGQQVQRGFVTFQTGMHELPDALRDHVTREGGTIRLGHRVDRITRQGEGPFVLGVCGPGGQERIEADGVVIATPARVSASLLTDLVPDAATAMAQIPQVSTALIALGYREGPGATPPNGFGYLVPRAEGRAVKAMTWLSAKWEGRAPEGHFLVRAFVGRSGEQEILQQSDEALVGIVRDEMRAVVGVTDAPVLSRVYRAVDAQPQFTLGHPGRVERIETAVARVPGLAVAGNMFRGVGIPDSIGTADQAAWSILDYCRDVGSVAREARVANG
jgi:oxygen-dependent protoporphyrinogen oxidase